MPLTSNMIIRSQQLAEKNARPARASSRQRSYSQEIITPELSLTVSAVLAAFTILSEDLSSLPLILYARRGRNKFRAFDSSYYRLMHDRPNPEHTSMIFRELVMGHLLGWGNFYGQLIVDKKGDVQEIWPLRPDRMTVGRVEGQRVYTYQTSEGKPRTFLDDELLHIPAFGFDGLIGYSRITMARNAIGLAISTEKYGSSFFSNGANFDIVIKHPSTLGDEAYAHLDSSIKEKHAGIENSHKPMILEENMSIEKIGIPPDDAQFLETRKFQVSEIARIFRVPPHMIGDVDSTTSWGSGIDSQEQGYVNHTLRPWAKRIEEQLNAYLLLEQDQSVYFYEHLMDGLLRGDIATRYAAYVSAINNGIQSPNEVRAKENMNPYKGGDVFWRPLNMTSSADSGNAEAPSDGATQPPSAKAAFPQMAEQFGGRNTSGGNALDPLWRDAVARVVKREANDLSGASQRYQVKGQQDAFGKWADHFYSVDHPAFMLKQFEPLIQAQKNLFHVDSGDAVDAFITSYLSERREDINTDVAMNVDETINKIMALLGDCFAESARNDMVEEFEYEQ